MQSSVIRKITIGKDYKNDSMHYAVGQNVYGGHTICNIIEEEDKYSVYIEKGDIVIPWKDFNKNMADAMEEVLRLVKKDQQDTAERIARLQEKEKADEGNFADGR